jgi:hypothetical protein
MQPLNLDLLDPRRDGSLELYAAQIQELVLWIRDEGHVLSSIDQHFIEQWWEAGYPLDSILEALRESGLRLKGRKKPPRGLPLRSMKKWVVKAGERARVVSVGHHEGDGSENHTVAAASPEHGAVVLETLSAELVAAQESASALSRTALTVAQTEVGGLTRESLGESELFAVLLGIGRRYYDACWESLSQPEQAERRGQISASLGDAADSMAPEAYETTLDELCRRALRGRDPLFDPQRYWSL